MLNTLSAAKAADGAGKWGDYRNCDLPPRTMDNLFSHLQSIQDQVILIF